MTDDERYPLQLVTGTVAYDSGNLFALTAQMHNMAFGPTVKLNPDDAAELGIADSDAVVVASPYGALNASAALSDRVQRGTAWMPESLPQTPVGALLNGKNTAAVRVVASRQRRLNH